MRRPGCNMKIIQPANHRQLGIHLGQRHRTHPRVQRLHHHAVGVQLIHGNGDAIGAVGARHVHLRDRLALGHPDFQEVRQHALDRNRINDRDHFQIALHRAQIERDEVGAGLDAGPAPQLFRGDLAVGLRVNLLDGEILVFIDERVQPQLADLPKQVQAEESAEHHQEGNARQPHAVRPQVVRAQFHLQHMVPVQPPISAWFAFKPH